MAKLCPHKYYEGPANAGEERLFRFLEVNLPNDYYIVPNGEYPSINAKGGVEYWEYDCIVVAPHAIYHLENKDWKGRIEGDDNSWFVNDHEFKNPIKTARFKSKILVAYLKKKNPLFGKAWVATAITLSSIGQTKSGLDPESGSFHDTFTLGDELIDYLTDPYRLGKAANAISDIQYEALDYLVGTSEGQSKKKTHILDLEIDRILDTTDDYIEYLCHPKLFKDKYYRVRDYVLDKAGLSPIEQEQHSARVQNGQISQELLPSSPNIIKTICQESDDGNHYYEKSEYMEDHTLLAEMRRKTFTEFDKVKILLDVAQALSLAHEKGVIHRDLNPSNIFLIDGGKTAAVANFNLSYNQMHVDLNMTVGTDAFTPTPYLPMEVMDGDVAPATDAYSFGVIAYELMTGEKFPFKDCVDFVNHGGILTEDYVPSHINPNIPEWVDELCQRTIVDNMAIRWGDIDEIRQFIIQSTFASAQPNPVQPSTQLKDLKSGDRIDNNLTLYEFVGEGGFSRVFKATHSLQPGKIYAVKIFSEDLAPKAAIDEFNVLQSLHHSNIVQFEFNGTTDGGLFYTLMDYVDGENIRKYAYGDLRLPLPKIYLLAQQMLSALAYLQDREKPIYHRDVKPENIMVDKSGKFILIDFNIAADVENVGKDKLGTYPYLAPDLTNGNKVTWDASADTFSLGVTLYEMLTHVYPWSGSKRVPVLDKEPTDIRTQNKQISDAFADFVMKAIGTRRENRFRNAKEMQDALFAIGPDNIYAEESLVLTHPDVDFSIVDYINSLYSQSERGNAGTRAGLKDNYLDQETYVETKLDTKLLDAITAGKFRLLIITGNAGDGKTAFIRRIEQAAENVEYFGDTRNGTKFKLGGIQYQSNYDGSQDESNLKNEEVLTKFFEPFENRHEFKSIQEGRIIAINEGRLMDFLLNNTDRHGYLAQVIDEYFYKGGTTELPEGVMVINLNLRSVTARENNQESLLRKQIHLLTAKKLWTRCAGCPIAERCFIKYNVDTLSDTAAGAEVVNRLEWLVRTIIYKREIHITMRDLRSLISWLLTRDFNCTDIPHLLQRFDELRAAWEADKENSEKKMRYYSYRQFMWDLYYFNITSPAYDADLRSEDRVVKLLRQTDIAQVAIPDKDLDLYYGEKHDVDYIEFAERKRTLLPDFNEASEIMPSYEQTPDELILLKRRHQTMIRHQYFEGKAAIYKDRPEYFKRLPYKSLYQFNKELNNEDPSAVVASLAYTISCSEGCWDRNLSKDYLILSSSRVKDPNSRSYRRFPISDFELAVDTNEKLVEYIEHENDCLIFRHKVKKEVRLNVSLDLREMLYYIEQGFNPSINDLKGRFIELQVFKNLLEAETYSEIIVTNDDNRYYRISLDKGSMTLMVAPL